MIKLTHSFIVSIILFSCDKSFFKSGCFYFTINLCLSNEIHIHRMFLNFLDMHFKIAPWVRSNKFSPYVLLASYLPFCNFNKLFISCSLLIDFSNSINSYLTKYSLGINEFDLTFGFQAITVENVYI